MKQLSIIHLLGRGSHFQQKDLCHMEEYGMGVAIGNANDAVKAVAGAVVADCDSGGIAEVINRFVL